MEPLLYVIKTIIVSDIVDHDDPVGAAVVGRSDRAEALLACCIPDLELDGLAIQLNCADLEVNTNR